MTNRFKFTRFGTGLWSSGGRASGSLKKEFALANAIGLLRVALAYEDGTTPLNAAVFENDRKTEERHPDYTLQITAYSREADVQIIRDNSELLQEIADFLRDNPDAGLPVEEQARGAAGGGGANAPRPRQIGSQRPLQQPERRQPNEEENDGLPF